MQKPVVEDILQEDKTLQVVDEAVGLTILLMQVVAEVVREDILAKDVVGS